MNIKLLSAYDEARMLRLSGKRVPSELLDRIKRMEEDFISKDLTSFLEHHLRYFLQGYESSVSLNVEFDPLTHDVSIQSTTSEAGDPGVKKAKSSLRSSKSKKTSEHQGRAVNFPNRYIVDPYYPQQQSKSRPKQSTPKKTAPQNNSSVGNSGVDKTDDDLKKYCDDFRRMKRKSGALGIKKAVMLLSMFELISCGHFITNEIFLDDSLIRKFGILWDSIVPREEKGAKDACKAFVYLYSEPFYRVKLNKSISSIDYNCKLETVREVIKSVSFDGLLFRLVQNKRARSLLIDYLADLFNLNLKKSSYKYNTEHSLNVGTMLISKPSLDEEPILKDGIVVFDENYDEVDINDFILYSKVDEYNEDEFARLKPSDLWGAVAIATSVSKKICYVIYDNSMQPLTHEGIIRFMLRTMITRDLLSYRYGSEVNNMIHSPNKLDNLDSLLKCTIFQEADPNTGKKSGYSLTMNRSITGFQVYTEFRNLTQMVYDCLMGEKHQELPNTFYRFVRNVAKQSFDS